MLVNEINIGCNVNEWVDLRVKYSVVCEGIFHYIQILTSPSSVKVRIQVTANLLSTFIYQFQFNNEFKRGHKSHEKKTNAKWKTRFMSTTTTTANDLPFPNLSFQLQVQHYHCGCTS